ncbi:hypothetical protein DENSPDRAFT_86336 [Dentipellis sp. KUC8613]|nr:hypothetical protein DENSPDRAFT_86336 [Dentipellis sp. KUC8613]
MKSRTECRSVVRAKRTLRDAASCPSDTLFAHRRPTDAISALWRPTDAAACTSSASCLNHALAFCSRSWFSHAHSRCYLAHVLSRPPSHAPASPCTCSCPRRALAPSSCPLAVSQTPFALFEPSAPFSAHLPSRRRRAPSLAPTRRRVIATSLHPSCHHVIPLTAFVCCHTSSHRRHKTLAAAICPRAALTRPCAQSPVFAPSPSFARFHAPSRVLPCRLACRLAVVLACRHPVSRHAAPSMQCRLCTALRGLGAAPSLGRAVSCRCVPMSLFLRRRRPAPSRHVLNPVALMSCAPAAPSHT